MTMPPGQDHEDIDVELNVVSLDDEPQFEASLTFGAIQTSHATSG